MSIPLLCIALLALLCIGLGFNVSMRRAKADTLYGVTIDPTDSLYKAFRAHGNTTEYAPLLALLIFILSQSPLASWELWSIILVTLSRYIFVIGILMSQTMAKAHPLRFIGSLGTYLGGLALVIAVLLQAMGN
jgi:uncharacterized membrane protein YecN with MAPEG domain